jgi:hypothetical protein
MQDGTEIILSAGAMKIILQRYFIIIIIIIIIIDMHV